MCSQGDDRPGINSQVSFHQQISRLIAISKPSTQSQNDEEKPIQDDDGEVDENLEEKMDESPPSCGLKEDSANAAQNGNAENNPNPMGQKTGDFRRENRQKSRNMQPALSKRRKNAISIPKMTKEVRTSLNILKY
jgi:hypothetical protein